ncbi:conserved hypothetical protein [Pediculus humanus corporis]|uniref:C2H2-type domain-containing protein n=1 Tax=Pediculus humanus subsp. corporis TaxID=121224 RepID=E0VQD8_PEDHC|nr:uncharacterized protein Phum_PHUM376510 [Pediculus humanus corporis]EEB15594.1 conserved hypothetical protein [Pediculus humanus corporis]
MDFTYNYFFVIFKFFHEDSRQWHIKHAFEKINGTGFKCKICGQIKKHVRNHYLKHFPEHHECHLCRRTYTRKDNLNSHLKRDHFQSIMEIVQGMFMQPLNTSLILQKQ